MPLKNHEKYRAYMRDYNRRRYAQRREQVLGILGNACVQCGSTDQLQVDTIDPAVQQYKISRMLSSLTWSKVEHELLNCQLLCLHCYKVKKTENQSVPHGGGLSGRRNCPCRPCKDRKNEWARKRKVKNALREELFAIWNERRSSSDP